MKLDICEGTVVDIQDGGNYVCVFIRDQGEYFFLKSTLQKNTEYQYMPIFISVDEFNSVEDNIIRAKKHFLKWFGFEPEVYISQNCHSLCPVLNTKFHPMVCEVKTHDEIDENPWWQNKSCVLSRVSINNMEMWRNNNYFFDMLLRELSGNSINMMEGVYS